MIPINTRVRVIQTSATGTVDKHWCNANRVRFDKERDWVYQTFVDQELEIIQEEKTVSQIAPIRITYSVPWSTTLFMTIEAGQTVMDAALAKFVHHATVIDKQTIVSRIEYEQNDKGLLFHANVVPKVDLTKATFIQPF